MSCVSLFCFDGGVWSMWAPLICVGPMIPQHDSSVFYRTSSGGTGARLSWCWFDPMDVEDGVNGFWVSMVIFGFWVVLLAAI